MAKLLVWDALPNGSLRLRGPAELNVSIKATGEPCKDPRDAKVLQVLDGGQLEDVTNRCSYKQCLSEIDRITRGG